MIVLHLILHPRLKLLKLHLIAAVPVKQLKKSKKQKKQKRAVAPVKQLKKKQKRKKLHLSLKIKKKVFLNLSLAVLFVGEFKQSQME